ncbi:hypothetical protein LXL04_038029 [Taraxacum kok-saghyz]
MSDGKKIKVVFEDDINSVSEALNYYETPAIQKYWMIMPSNRCLGFLLQKINPCETRKIINNDKYVFITCQAFY